MGIAPAGPSESFGKLRFWLERWWSRAPWVAMLGLGIVLAGQLQQIGDFRVDDAYISFSFSKNFGAGNGLVFSHGMRVEGYSNFLWVILVGLGYLVSPGLEPYRLARILAVGFLLATAVLVYRQSRRRAGVWFAIGALVPLAYCSDMARAAVSGLETVAYVFAYALGWALLSSDSPEIRRRALWAFLPMALFRIDGFVPALAAIGFELADRVIHRRFDLASLARWLLPPLLVWLAYYAWRYAYYGLPLPATYYAKTLANATEPDRGFNQLWAFLKASGGLALVPLAIVGVVRGARRAGLALLTGIAVQIWYVGQVGGDWMPFWRFFLPLIPPTLILASWGAAHLWQEARLWGWELRFVYLAGLAALLVFVTRRVDASTTETPEEKQILAEAQHTLTHTRDNLLAVADLVRLIPRKPGEKLVTDYAGVFSVYTDATIIDQWGLCNEDIALNGGMEGINSIYGKECSECYARINPDYFHLIVPIVRSPKAIRSPIEAVSQIFQGWAIDRVIGLRQNFAVGRVVEEDSERTVWFMEKRRPGIPLVPRRPAPGIMIDYPFEVAVK